MNDSQAKYITQLDGVRAMAALMVMYFHFFEGNPLPGGTIYNFLQKTSIIGQTGVSLFFVLSGFLITRILISTKSSEHYFKNFYFRRILRILPLYYFFLLLFYFVYKPIMYGYIPPFKDQSVYYFYLQNFFITFGSHTDGPMHFWSLAVEEHFYFLWPFLVFVTDIKHLVRWILGLICLSVVMRVILIYYHHEVFYLTFTRLDEICFGALLAVLVMQKNKLLTLLKGKYFYILVLSYLLLLLGAWWVTSGKANSFMQVIKFLFYGIFYFLFIGYTINNENHITAIFKNRVLVYLGKISYGLYVYHPVCFHIANKYLKSSNGIVNFFTNFSLTILVAVISYHFFEVRFLKLKRYFGNDKISIISSPQKK